MNQRMTEFSETTHTLLSSFPVIEGRLDFVVPSDTKYHQNCYLILVDKIPNIDEEFQWIISKSKFDHKLQMKGNWKRFDLKTAQYTWKMKKVAYYYRIFVHATTAEKTLLLELFMYDDRSFCEKYTEVVEESDDAADCKQGDTFYCKPCDTDYFRSERVSCSIDGCTEEICMDCFENEPVWHISCCESDNLCDVHWAAHLTECGFCFNKNKFDFSIKQWNRNHIFLRL